MRAIKQNLFWAFIYNLILIPLAVLGLVTPLLAAAAMALSSVSVVGNSLRLGRFRRTPGAHRRQAGDASGASDGSEAGGRVIGRASQ